MDRYYPLYRDTLGKFYQLLRTPGTAHSASKRMTFFCPELTKRFLRSLNVPQDYWRRFLLMAGRDSLPYHLSDNDIVEHVAGRLIAGSLQAYEFPSLNKHALKDGKEAAFGFVRGPVPLPTDGECLGEQEARECLGGLRATPSFWHEILQENGFLLQELNPETSGEGEYRAVVDKLLASRELLLYKTKDASARPKPGGAGQTESAANTPGNRMAHREEPPKGPVREVEAEQVKDTREEACEELGKCEISEAEAAEKGGIAPEHMDAIKSVCEENNAVISFRDSNPDCIKHMRDGVKSKGLDVKQKTFSSANLPGSHKDQAGLVSTLMEKPKKGEILSGEQLAPYKTKKGEILTGDYDMHEMIDATTGERIVGESRRDLDLRKALNAEIGNERIMHGSQASYMEYCETYNKEPEFELMQPDPPVTVVDGKEPVTFYRLESDEQILNMYNCKGTEVPPHWNFQNKENGA